MIQTDDSQSFPCMPAVGREVECYSGHTYAEEPRRFVIGNERLTVTEVCRRWREPTGPCFEILAGNGARYTLIYNEAGDVWTVVPYELTLSVDVHKAHNNHNNREDGRR